MTQLEHDCILIVLGVSAEICKDFGLVAVHYFTVQLQYSTVQYYTTTKNVYRIMHCWSWIEAYECIARCRMQSWRALLSLWVVQHLSPSRSELGRRPKIAHFFLHTFRISERPWKWSHEHERMSMLLRVLGIFLRLRNSALMCTHAGLQEQRFHKQGFGNTEALHLR